LEVTRIFDLLDRYAQLCPEKGDALAGKDNGGWKMYSTREWIDNSRQVSYGLMKHHQGLTNRFPLHRWSPLYEKYIIPADLLSGNH